MLAADIGALDSFCILDGNVDSRRNVVLRSR